MEEGRKPFTSEEIVKLLAIILVMIALLLYSIFTGSKREKTPVNNEVVSVNLKELFEPIKDNYSLSIDRTIGEKEERIDFITDGTLKLYNVNNSDNGYLIYNNKTYYVEQKSFKIKEYNKKQDFLNDSFANINFIKSIVDYCENENVFNQIECHMNVSDYINKYNEYFYTSHVYDGDEKIVFKFTYGSVVNLINVDYSTINRVIKKYDSDIVKYSIKISRVNGNDYSNLLEVYKDTLKK